MMHFILIAIGLLSGRLLSILGALKKLNNMKKYLLISIMLLGTLGCDDSSYTPRTNDRISVGAAQAFTLVVGILNRSPACAKVIEIESDLSELDNQIDSIKRNITPPKYEGPFIMGSAIWGKFVDTPVGKVGLVEQNGKLYFVDGVVCLKQFNNEECLFGTSFNVGYVRRSNPPVYYPIGKNNAEILSRSDEDTYNSAQKDYREELNSYYQSRSRLPVLQQKRPGLVWALSTQQKLCDKE
jgi:hypothetical protein